MAVTIGVDAHKRSHTLVGIDERGRKLATKTVDATSTGHADALRWARMKFGDDLVWGVEDVRSVSAPLERDLLAAGQRVVRVPPRLMGQIRASARVAGKSDPLDALAVARTVLQEPDLPVARLDDASRDLKLLVDRREDLLEQLIATTNRLLWRLHELDPAGGPKRGALSAARHRRAAADFLATRDGLVAELARAELDDVNRLAALTRELEKRIAAIVKVSAPNLLALPGCGPLTAAKIVGETADVSRFKNEAAFARHAGVAPVPHWSATPGHQRYVRSGNRQLNMALHRIAVTQLTMGAAGRAYVEKRVDQGDRRPAAVRALKRRLARVVFTRLHADQALRAERPAARQPPHDRGADIESTASHGIAG